MTRNKIAALLTFLILLVIVQPPVVKSQQGLNRVGLVVQFGDGRIETDCVEFEEDSITGYQVFERSKFDFIPSFFSGEGWAICKIEEDGCPASDCFCNSYLFWSYWSLVDGAWLYSVRGASNFNVHDGDVQGWRWSEGSAPDEVYDIDELCSEATQTPTKTSPPPTKTQSQQAIFPSDTPNASHTATNQNQTGTHTPIPTNTQAQTQTQTLRPSLAPSFTATPNHSQTVALLVETAIYTTQPASTGLPYQTETSPEATATSQPKLNKTEPSATAKGFQKSDKPVVLLLEGTPTETPLQNDNQEEGGSLSKMAVLAGGLIGYLVFIVLVGGLGIGLLVLLLMRRK